MPTNRDALLIRTMTLADLDLVLDLAAAEGWNPGLRDAIPFYAADPEGFLLGELAGEPIGTISAVRYGQDLGFIGCFIVRLPWRGQGYGVISPCRQGFKIGSLFADTAEIAGGLFQSLSTQAAHQPIFLDIPDANPAALDLVQTQQMEPVFTCARMYTQSPPVIPIEQVFAVTSLELG
jgi:Acetyltransferase (GNAT) domain